MPNAVYIAMNQPHKIPVFIEVIFQWGEINVDINSNLSSEIFNM
jgi:hypothetical protein